MIWIYIAIQIMIILLWRMLYNRKSLDKALLLLREAYEEPICSPLWHEHSCNLLISEGIIERDTE